MSALHAPAQPDPDNPICTTYSTDGKMCGKPARHRNRTLIDGKVGETSEWWYKCDDCHEVWYERFIRYNAGNTNIEVQHMEAAVAEPPDDLPQAEPPDDPPAAEPADDLPMAEPGDEPLPEPPPCNTSELVVLLDLETTGSDIANDRIVEFAAHKFYVGNEPGPAPEATDALVFRCRPSIPIHPEATAVHGISDGDVATLPYFRVFAKQVAEFIGDLPIAGFNVLGFDWPLLWEELYRCGQIVADRPVIDAFRIFRKKEERTLKAAVKFYCGREHEEAHEALADVVATGEVLMGQMEKYPDLGRSVMELAEFSADGPRVDIAGKFTRNTEGVIVYAFGKNKGQPVKNDPGYARWVANDPGFTTQTKLVLRQIMEDKLK